MKFFYCIFAFTVILSCQNPLPPIPTDLCQAELLIKSSHPCDTIPAPPQGADYILKAPDSVYWVPEINPTNPDEMVVLLSYTLNGFDYGRDVYFINLCTGEKRFLVGDVRGGVDWSVKNWLIFDRWDYQLWKIKSNGDSLTQLTDQHRNYVPKWNPEGTKFLFYREDGSPRNNLVLMDENGNFIREMDSTLGGWLGYEWAPDGQRYAFGYDDDIRIADLEDNLLLTIPAPDIGDLRWIDNSEEVWWASLKKGVCMTDLKTLETTVFKESCGNMKYTAPWRVTGTNNLMFVRLDYKLISKDTLYREPVIVFMDDSGENERVLQVPRP